MYYYLLLLLVKSLTNTGYEVFYLFLVLAYPLKVDEHLEKVHVH